MSFFATITGYLRYRTAAHHQAALDRLQTGGWLDEKYRWYAQGSAGLPIDILPPLKLVGFLHVGESGEA